MPGADRWHVQARHDLEAHVTRTRILTIFGIADIAVGVAVWAATGNALVGIAIVLVGIALLIVPAVRVQRPDEPEDALANERADQQRLHDETAATAENVEGRPPPTGA